MSAGSPRLSVRHLQSDFFVHGILDPAPNGDVGSMEHPIFSLETVLEHDVLIYCISSLISAANRMTTGRGTEGPDVYGMARKVAPG